MNNIKLTDNWKVQISEKIHASGAELSSQKADTDDWYRAVVPSTIMGTLVANGVYSDAYIGKNMENIPKEQFEVPWWYVTSFELTAKQADKTVQMIFDGINYKANVWLNGKQVAGSDKINGAFRHLKFNVSDLVQEGENRIAIEVIPPQRGDFSIGFVDWNVWPPDTNMGIFRDVTLYFSNEVSIDKQYVETKIDKDTLASAELKITAELINHSEKSVTGTLKCDLGDHVISKEVTLDAGGNAEVVFSPEEFPELKISDPELWWPNTMGEPNLHDLDISFESDGKVSDSVHVKYGIREVEDYINEDGHRGYKVNGKKVLIKGGGWTDDLFLQDTHDSLKAQIDYVKHMNLNTIRLEGFWGKDHKLYDLCDENGILIMVGWSCHWEHENHLGKPVDPRYGGVVEPDEIDLIAKSWEEQVIWLRQHPSIFVWAVGSDFVPHPDLERRYIETFKKYDPTRPYLNSTGGVGSEQGIISTTEIVSEISGSSCVKMLGPYAYTPPVYWYTNLNLGGAYGFNTETCPGANVPPLSSLKKFIPEDHLWPVDDVWEYHCGTNEFRTLDRFIKAIDKRYGGADNVEEFAFKAQILNYELMRPMFEAFVAHQPKSTGIIQWMLNSAWPEMYWQLYDSFLQPNGAFYATRKACKMLHAIYRYGWNDVYLANNHLNGAEGLTVKFRVFDTDANVVYEDEWQGNITGNTSEKIHELPDLKEFSDVVFLDMRIFDKTGKEIDSNFYWLSKKEDVLDYEAGKTLEWEYHTPSKQYADFTSLKNLPAVDLNIDTKYEVSGDKGKVTVKIKNPSDTISFFNVFDVVDPSTGEPVLPVFWNDNHISFLPGEEVELTAEFYLKDLNGEKPALSIEGWNSGKHILELA